MFKVLITAPYMQKQRDLVSGLFEQKLRQTDLDLEIDWIPVEERMDEDQLLEIIDVYDGVICGDDRFTPKVYQKAKNLKVLVKWGTGIDSLNQSSAEEHGIKLCRTPDAFTVPVAETTIGMILSLTRRIYESTINLKNGGWEKRLGYCLTESTIGLIGFGNIGTAVAERLKPFGSRVLVNDIKELDPELCASLGVTSVSKEQIYKESDIISVHCDLNETSRHLINNNVFQQLGKKEVLFFNVSRGPIVKESDLVGALQNGILGGAGLDVFEDEPLPLTSPLRSMPNVLLSAHNSNSSPYYWKRVHENSIDMLFEHLKM